MADQLPRDGVEWFTRMFSGSLPHYNLHLHPKKFVDGFFMVVHLRNLYSQRELLDVIHFYALKRRCCLSFMTETQWMFSY